MSYMKRHSSCKSLNHSSSPYKVLKSDLQDAYEHEKAHIYILEVLDMIYWSWINITFGTRQYLLNTMNVFLRAQHHICSSYQKMSPELFCINLTDMV